MSTPDILSLLLLLAHLSVATSLAATPTPIQPGFPTGCQDFAQALPGDTCVFFAQKHFNANIDLFLARNPQIGGLAGCPQNVAAYNWYCLGPNDAARATLTTPGPPSSVKSVPPPASFSPLSAPSSSSPPPAPPSSTPPPVPSSSSPPPVPSSSSPPPAPVSSSPPPAPASSPKPSPSSSTYSHVTVPPAKSGAPHISVPSHSQLPPPIATGDCEPNNCYLAYVIAPFKVNQVPSQRSFCSSMTNMGKEATTYWGAYNIISIPPPIETECGSEYGKQHPMGLTIQSYCSCYLAGKLTAQFPQGFTHVGDNHNEPWHSPIYYGTPTPYPDKPCSTNNCYHAFQIATSLTSVHQSKFCSAVLDQGPGHPAMTEEVWSRMPNIPQAPAEQCAPMSPAPQWVTAYCNCWMRGQLTATGLQFTNPDPKGNPKWKSPDYAAQGFRRGLGPVTTTGPGLVTTTW